MRVIERQPGDIQRITALIAAEHDADQRDRYRIVLLALLGEEKLRIAGVLGVCKRTVEDWAYRYRDHGFDAIKAKPRGGSSPKLGTPVCAMLARRLDAGPTAQDNVCTLRGKDVQRIANDESGTRHRERATARARTLTARSSVRVRSAISLRDAARRCGLSLLCFLLSANIALMIRGPCRRHASVVHHRQPRHP